MQLDKISLEIGVSNMQHLQVMNDIFEKIITPEIFLCIAKIKIK